MRPTQKLIKETQALIRLRFFLQKEVGLRENLSARDLKQLLSVLKKKKD